MTDNELFELCKEVFRRTEWKRDDAEQYEHRYGLESIYTSDYLLEKLPTGAGVKKNGGLSISYVARLELVKDYSKASDTPLKALLKLTIALHEAGELK